MSYLFSLKWHGIKAKSIICYCLLSHLPSIGSPSAIILFSRIISDHPDHLRSGVAHLWSSQLISRTFPSWSTGASWVYEDFFLIYWSSEVGFLPIFVKVQYFPLVFISAVQDLGSGFDLTETTSSSCIKLLFLHPHPLICVHITRWGPRVDLATANRDVLHSALLLIVIQTLLLLFIT